VGAFVLGVTASDTAVVLDSGFCMKTIRVRSSIRRVVARGAVKRSMMRWSSMRSIRAELIAMANGVLQTQRSGRPAGRRSGTALPFHKARGDHVLMRQAASILIVARCKTSGTSMDSFCTQIGLDGDRWKNRFATGRLLMARAKRKAVKRLFWRREGFGTKRFFTRIVVRILLSFGRSMTDNCCRSKTEGHARMRKALNLAYSTWSDHESGFILPSE